MKYEVDFGGEQSVHFAGWMFEVSEALKQRGDFGVGQTTVRIKIKLVLIWQILPNAGSKREFEVIGLIWMRSKRGLISSVERRPDFYTFSRALSKNATF